MYDFEKMAGWKELMALGKQAVTDVPYMHVDAKIDKDRDGLITRPAAFTEKYVWTCFFTEKYGWTEEQANAWFDGQQKGSIDPGSSRRLDGA